MSDGVNDINPISIMATSQADLVKALNAISAQVTKIGTESAATLQKVSDLEAAVATAAAAGVTSPEVDTALAALKAQVQVVDDLVADVPANPNVPPVDPIP